MSFFQKWFKENIRNGLVAIFELFLWAKVRKTVWERGFLTFFKSYSTWEKWQNNLILMVTEIPGNSPLSIEQCTESLKVHLCTYALICELFQMCWVDQALIPGGMESTLQIL